MIDTQIRTYYNMKEPKTEAERLYFKYLPKILKMIKTYPGHMRDDLLQEAFLAVANSVKNTNHPDGIVPYAYLRKAVASNLFKYYLKHAVDVTPSYRKALSEYKTYNHKRTNIDWLEEEVTDNSLEKIVGDQEVEDIVKKTIESMETPLNTIMTHYMQGLNLRESAEIVGYSTEHVRQLRLKGLDLLREVL